MDLREQNPPRLETDDAAPRADGVRRFRRRVGEIAREVGVSSGMPDNWIVDSGTTPAYGPSGSTNSGRQDLR